MSGIRPCQSAILCIYPFLREWGWRGQCKGQQPDLKVKFLPQHHLPIHLCPQAESDRQGESSQFSELPAQPASLRAVLPQGHWKVGKGEERSWEMTEAGYLEKNSWEEEKEAARMGGI